MIDYGKHTKLSSDQMDRVARLISSRHAWTTRLAKRHVRGFWATPNEVIAAGLEAPHALRISAMSAVHLINYRTKKQGISFPEDAQIVAWLTDASISPSWIAYGPLVVSRVTQWPDDAIGKKNTLCVAHLADFLAEVAYGN